MPVQVCDRMGLVGSYNDRKAIMSRLRIEVLIACGSSILPMFQAHAGPCTEQIAQFERTLPPETTRSTQRQAQGASPKAADRETAAEAALARARRFDAEGRRAECLNALAAARRLSR